MLAGLMWMQCGMAQVFEPRWPSGRFEESVFYAYALQESDTFELKNDALGLHVASICEEEVSERIWETFLKLKHDEFHRYATLDKEDFGVLVQHWVDALPQEVYLALLKQENYRTIVQNNYCSASEPFCADNGMYEFPAGVDSGSGEPGPYYNCLLMTSNPAWYYLRIMEPGDMDIYIYSTPQVDIDFCCWGPFENPIEPCPDGLTNDKVASCSFSSSCEETCKIRGAQRGEFYVLLITNSSNLPANIHFSKVEGDATTDCSIFPPYLSYEPICSGLDLVLTAIGPVGSVYHWFKVDGGWTSDEQNPVRPHATPEMSGTYGCAISIDGTQSDTTYLEVAIDDFFHETVDLLMECDVAVWDSLTFEESGIYTLSYVTAEGCDSIIELNVDLNHRPLFEIQGLHYPIGGSETYISVNEYSIELDNPKTVLDTVLWQIDCPNWDVVPHGKGERCTLYIYTFVTDTVMLHATAINQCGTIHEEFFIRASYFAVDEQVDESCFEVMPNPTNGNLTLHFDGLQGIVEIKVYNSQGQQMDAFTVDASQYHEKAYIMSGMRNGMYFFVLKDERRNWIRKVVLLR